MHTPLSLSFAPGRLSLRHGLIIAIFGLLVLLPASWPGGITLSAHEVLAAEPAREMLRDGQWLIPHYAGMPRYEKPPTTSWLIAGSMALFRTEAVWAVRLPSILAGIGSSLVIAALAARWLGNLAGLLSGLVQLTSVWLLTQANLAEADIHLVLWVSVSMWLFALANVPHTSGVISRPWIRPAFMASLGILFLFKGPVPLLFVILACGLWIALTRRWSTWRFFASPLGIAIFLVLLLAWPAAAAFSDPQILHRWNQEIFGRVDATTFGRKSPFIYIANIPLMLLPWLPLLLPVAIATKRRRWLARPFPLLLICWFLPGMCILQLASFRSVHYSFPLLPPFSIAMAAGLMLWTQLQQEHEAIKRRILAGLITLSAAAGMIAIGMLRPQLSASVPPILCAIAVGLLLTLYLEHRRQVGRALTALFATVGIALIMVNLLVMPAFKSDRPRVEFAQRLNALIGQGQTLYMIDVIYDEMVWHLSVPLLRIDDPIALAQHNLPAEGIYALARKRALPKLEAGYVVRQLDGPSEQKRNRGADEAPILIHLAPRLPASAPAY